MIVVTAPGIGTVRALTWDDENRLTRTIEGGTATDYVYDDAGKRVIKKSGLGEVLYVNENYSVRNGDVASCHIFAGNTRVATTMKAPGADESVYYYHGDHLGSSSVVTNGAGAFHEGLEYFPYGETWVHASASPGSQSMPYRFTSKEQDPETGLYYFGARYYDARLSKWISTDPALGSYLPGAGEGDDDLPGIGGVFNPVNMNVYHYGGNNPVRFIDPDGNVIEYQGYVLPYPAGTSVAITSKFGNRIIYQQSGPNWFSIRVPVIRSHEGVDSIPSILPKIERTKVPVVAVANGIVTFSGRRGWYGNCIDIMHGYDEAGGPVVTRYAHLLDNSLRVNKGDRVSKDQELGLVGSTGKSTGPHVHYEIHIHNTSINPQFINVEHLIHIPLSNSFGGRYNEGFFINILNMNGNNNSSSRSGDCGFSFTTGVSW